MHFKNIKKEDFDRINELLAKTQYKGCEYSKLYLMAWDYFDFDSFEIAYENDVIFMRFTPNPEYVNGPEKLKHIYIPPLTTLDKMKEAILMVEKQTKEDSELMLMDGLSLEQIEVVDKSKFEIIENDDYKEYLYNPNDLINFSGKKYHSKRNHIADFNKKYSYVFRQYNKELDYKNLILLIKNWENGKEYYSLDDKSSEEKAINISLDLLETESNIFAYVLYVGDKLIGFSLIEKTASNIVIEHIEKADINYVGVYPMLLNLVAKEAFSGCRYVNRQEDMGNEGLRKSKLSYKPVAFCEKYFIKNFKEDIFKD